MSKRRRVRSLESDLGELLERHERGSAGFGDLSRYSDRPAAFMDVFGWELTDYQEAITRDLLAHPLVTVRSCHAAGKDWLAARLALWWTYARRGLVVLTGPTAAQVEEILMRGELRDAFQRSGLLGDLHVNALRPGGEGRAGVLAKTATGVSSLTGFHDARVLFIITEAQDPAIDHAWDAAFACTTGAEDRVLTLGNPIERSGRFYRAHRPSSDWHAIKVAARDVPNVREGRTVVPGLLTREGVARFANEYGEGSPFYVSRVLAEFPDSSADGLFRRSWLEAAAARWEDGGPRSGELVVAVDPARFGPDATCLAVRRGDRLEKLLTWGRQDTMTSVERIQRELTRLGVRPRDKVGEAWLRRNGSSEKIPEAATVVVDAIGIGSGIHDRLSELDYDSHAYKASHAPKDGERFRNLRAESYWRLRDRLEAGEIALPRDEKLFEELLALRWAPTPAGKVQIGSKDEVRSRLGRSPDRADAVAMAYWARIRRGPPAGLTLHYD